VVINFLPSIGALRRNLGLIAMFFFLHVTQVLLAVGAWSGKASVNTTGGGFGILTAWIAYYNGLSYLLVKGERWFGLPLGSIKQERSQ
jgi:succinate-acetate transporter protein